MFSITLTETMKMQKYPLYSEVQVLVESGFFLNVGLNKNDF